MAYLLIDLHNDSRDMLAETPENIINYARFRLGSIRLLKGNILLNITDLKQAKAFLKADGFRVHELTKRYFTSNRRIHRFIFSDNLEDVKRDGEGNFVYDIENLDFACLHPSSFD